MKESKYYIFMKYAVFSTLAVMFLGCSQQQEKKDIERILPIKFKISDSFSYLETVGPLKPYVYFNIDLENIEVIVGSSERYQFPYRQTQLEIILKKFKVEDFQNNGVFYNAYFPILRRLGVTKNIDGIEYYQEFSGEPQYDNIDTEKADRFSLLANYLVKMAYDILQDEVRIDAASTAFSISEALKRPEDIYKLNLRNSGVRVLPPEIGQLVNLRVLDFSGTSIRSIPAEIENCTHLRSIIGNASRLSIIPNSICNLRKLREINFAYCRIRELPKNFGNLESLWELHLSYNQLNDLPESMSNLNNLVFFNIYGNKFQEFPKEVLDMECVGTLWMHKNDFKYIPQEIANLEHLYHFLVDSNDIENMGEIRALLSNVRLER